MKQKSAKKIFSIITLCVVSVSVAVLAATVPVQAQETICESPATEDLNFCSKGQCRLGDRCVVANPAPRNLVSFDNFGAVLTLIIRWLLYFAGAIAVIFLMIGGFQYVTAHGSEEATEKAKKTVTGAIIGIVLIVMAYAIVAIVNTLLTSPPGK